MFGLYPAGAQWVRHFNSKRTPRDIRKVLTDFAGLTAGIFHTPFGSHRGAVLAQSGRFLILAAAVDSSTANLAVVPDVQMQNLLWSFNTGYANQWGARELLALTGLDNWSDLLQRTSAEFGAVCQTVSDAADGTLERRIAEEARAATAAEQDSVVGVMFSNGDDAAWLPSDYLYDAPQEAI